MQWPSRSERVDRKLQLRKLLWGHCSHRNSNCSAGTTQWFDRSRNCTHRSCNIARSERSVAAPSDNFWEKFQPHHAVTVREIYREVVTWKPSFFTLSKTKTGEQIAEALHSVLSPIAVNTDRSDKSLTVCMILTHLILSRTKNTDDESNKKTIKRRLRAFHVQGSLLGPLLFCITYLMINDLPDVLVFSDPFIFADDLKILAVKKTFWQVQNDLNGIEQWVNENKMKLAMDKCAKLSIRGQTQN